MFWLLGVGICLFIFYVQSNWQYTYTNHQRITMLCCIITIAKSYTNTLTVAVVNTRTITTHYKYLSTKKQQW